MSQWRKSAFLLSVVVGAVILIAALLLSLARLGGPTPAPTWSASASALSTSAPPPAPTETTETRPTPSLARAATLTAPPSTETAAAYPAPVQPETLAPTVASTALPAGTRVGQLAPDFNLIRENGSRVRLSDYQGEQTVVLVFFRGQT